MKKSELTMAVIIGMVCVVLMTVILLQFKTIEQTDLTGIKTAREEELKTMLSSYKTKYEEIDEKLNDTKQKIQEYQTTISTNDENSEVLQKELEQTNMLVGKTNVVGEGVVVTLTNNELKSIEPSDLRTLINELKLAGAEAISINDKRILNMSEIVQVGERILVNDDRVTSPYVVKAIGDKKYLSSALSLKNSGFIDITSKSGKTITMETDNKINIQAYSSQKNQFNLKYAKEVKE